MEGKQRETLRGEEPVRPGVLRVFPGQRVGSFRADNPKVAASNPAPATQSEAWGLFVSGPLSSPLGCSVVVAAITAIGRCSWVEILLCRCRGEKVPLSKGAVERK